MSGIWEGLGSLTVSSHRDPLALEQECHLSSHLSQSCSHLLLLHLTQPNAQLKDKEQRALDKGTKDRWHKSVFPACSPASNWLQMFPQATSLRVTLFTRKALSSIALPWKASNPGLWSQPPVSHQELEAGSCL